MCGGADIVSAIQLVQDAVGILPLQHLDGNRDKLFNVSLTIH